MSTSAQIYVHDVSSPLGSGKYGTVFRGDYHGTPVAIKVVGITTTSSPKFSSKENDAFDKECELMKECIHDNIVQYMRSTKVKMNGSIYPALVMTMMDTDLRKYLGFQECDLPPHKEIKIAHDVTKALNYLHVMKKIVHGDLHTGNVLLRCLSAIEGPLVKICDFGLTKAVQAQLSQHFSTYRTVTSEEGEIQSTDEDSSVVIVESTSEFDPTKPISAKAQEIRNFGHIMWEIHSRCKPQIGSKRDHNLQAIQGRPMHDVVCRCWDDADKQPTAAELTEIFTELQKQYPVKDPYDALHTTIASQQETINRQQETIEHQQEKIERQQEKIECLQQKVNEFQKAEIENLKGTIEKMQIQKVN